MTTPCKICESEFKDFAESLILNGESNNSVADTLQGKGLIISHASVNRHKNKHMIEHKERIEELATSIHNTKYDRSDNVNCIDMEKIIDDAKELARKQINQKDLRENYRVNHILITRIATNQLAITVDLQEKFMQGKTKYPHEQIRGLQIIQDLSAKLNNEFATNQDMTFTDMANDIIKKSIHGIINPTQANTLMVLIEKVTKIKTVDELETRISNLESKNDD